MLILKFGPSLAGLMCAWLIGGRSGLTNLLKRGLRWRTPWCVVAVALGIPAVALVISLLVSGPVRISEIFTGRAVTTLIPTAAFKVLFGGGFGEEFGWRGFMQSKLEESHSLFTASMFVGVVWIVWHLPAALLGGDIANPVTFSATLLGYSVILAWIFHRSRGSVLWAAIFHGWANGLSNTYDRVIGEQIADAAAYANASYAGIIVLAAGILLMASRNPAASARRW